MILKTFFLEPCFWTEWGSRGDGGVDGWSNCSDSCPCADDWVNFPFGAYLTRSKDCECPDPNSLPCPTEDDSSIEYRPNKSKPTEAYEYLLCLNSECPRK